MRDLTHGPRGRAYRSLGISGFFVPYVTGLYRVGYRIQGFVTGSLSSTEPSVSSVVVVQTIVKRSCMIETGILVHLRSRCREHQIVPLFFRSTHTHMLMLWF